MRYFVALQVNLLLSFLVSCVPAYYPSDGGTSTNVNIASLSYNDEIYDENINTVVLVPEKQQFNRFHSPVLPLNSSESLLLEFDEISDSFSDFMVKIVPMRANWSPSQLSSIDYLEEYNEFRITDSSLGLSGEIEYVHYRFEVPKVKISGNFCLLVYREQDPDFIVFSRRFVVFENEVTIENRAGEQGMVSFIGHNMDFSVQYGSSSIADPLLYLKASIRQNNRWDNAVSTLRPTQVQDDRKLARFQYFDNSASFSPGNEFRFFDIRSILSPGVNIDSVRKLADPPKVWITTDRSREGLAYTYYDDLNGTFLIGSLDNRSIQYVETTFRLWAPNLAATEKVYVAGEWSMWNKRDKYLMKPIAENLYACTLLLKQGYYSYTYLVDSENKPENYLEGDHINTENQYEIFIYDTDPILRSERCIGYYQFGLNERIR